jgi:arsenate reductase (glutaredoxin)
MKKIYHLSTCSTCRRILADLSPDSTVILQDIKKEAVTGLQLEEMKRLSGSYGALFSRKAQKYTSMGLKDKNIGEEDYRNLILSDYTFLKRPVIIVGEEIFIGNDAAVTARAKNALAR